jgi:uncharacterized FAD-dependent dehydrogenase
VALLVGNVEWAEDLGDPAPVVAAQLGVPAGAVRSTRLLKKSLDARHRKATWRATFRVEVDDEARVLQKRLPSVRAWTSRDEERYGETQAIRTGGWRGGKPIVVGAGPAGLFAALVLAEAGAPVVLLERGGPVEARVPAVNKFWQRKLPLDPENNLIFGEGGAGTFSDGKIYTRRRDGELGFIFRRLIEFGADPRVMEDSFAHLGTDKVREILPVFRRRLQELGADVRFSAHVTALIVRDGACHGVRLADGTEIEGSPVIVAAGHSARDSGEMLVRAGVRAEARPIAIGARIEHPQSLVDAARYPRGRGELPAASYRLAWNPKIGRKAHTFCMCPGGMVVPASNHPDRVVVNGMSFAARKAFWANSAVIVEVGPEDYAAPPIPGSSGPREPAAIDPLAGYRWQDAIEKSAFAAGGSDYRAPAQRVTDLLAGTASAELPRTSFPMGVTSFDLRDLLPEPVWRGMIAAIQRFDRELPGFAGPEAVLIAPETRTTSPVRFERDARGEATTVKGLYPCGEGAGYGGGIVSCALDGLRAARAAVETACG